jgi:ApbE superfamily uncharacterized protein (UPF0280 family)
MGWIQRLLQALQGVPTAAVLRERVAFEEKKCEAALQQVEQLKQKVEALERENAELRAQIPQAKEVVLSDDTNQEVVLSDDANRVLVHMFKAAQAEDVGTMATALGMERGLLQSHLERLLQSGLAGNFYRKRNTYWVLTSKGRRRVVERAS